jgi:WD40 repeat protein
MNPANFEKTFIQFVAFSPVGNRIVSGDHDDGTVTLWDSATGKVLWNLRGHNSSVFAVAFSPDSKRVVSGGLTDKSGNGNAIKLWDTESGKELLALQGHQENIYSVVFSPDGKLIVSGGYDRTLRIWDGTK